MKNLFLTFLLFGFAFGTVACGKCDDAKDNYCAAVASGDQQAIADAEAEVEAECCDEEAEEFGVQISNGTACN